MCERRNGENNTTRESLQPQHATHHDRVVACVCAAIAGPFLNKGRGGVEEEEKEEGGHEEGEEGEGGTG